MCLCGGFIHSSDFDSSLLQNKVLTQLLEFREQQKVYGLPCAAASASLTFSFGHRELAKGATCGITLGDVTSINCSFLKVRICLPAAARTRTHLTSRAQAGVTTDGQNFTMNMVPPEAEAGFDIRIAPQVNRVEFKAKVSLVSSS